MWLTVVCGCRLYNLWLTVVEALIGGCSLFSLVFGADTIFSAEWSNSLRNQESTIQSALPIVREFVADVSMTLGSGLCGENVTKRSKILESKISRHGPRAEFMKKSCLHKPLMIATFIYIMENWVEIMLPIIKQRFSLKIFLEAFLSAAELDAYRFEKKWSKKLFFSSLPLLPRIPFLCASWCDSLSHLHIEQ